MADLTPDLVLAKTSKGTREIAERIFGLDLRLRRALILVDGKATLGELMRRAAGIPDFVETLGTLVDRGFVAPASDAASVHDEITRPLRDDAPHAADRPPQAQVIELARQLLGEHAGRVVARLESGGAGAVELGMSVDACYKLIRLTIDEKKAEDFLRRARRILAAG
jgi:hypothetical protein